METSQPAATSSQTPSAPSTNPSSTLTGPQIRSRITVVCAECKRLKLKCDRRSPCGSCTKRDTVPRCVYSPAAAEKVDLHSLNNRLIQVESILSMITAGQIPPAFQPAYPLSTTSSSTNSTAPSSQTLHQHHHHYAANVSLNDSIMLSFQDVTTIWLNDLDQELSIPTSQNDANPNSPNYIKLEPCSGDFGLSRPSTTNHDNGHVVIDIDGSHHMSSTSALQSRSSTPPENTHSHSQRHSPAAQLYLPALSIYYPIPSVALPGTSPTSSAAFPQHPTSLINAFPVGASASASPAQPQLTKPQVTPELLALLPSLSACRFLLQRAADVFRVRPVPFETGAYRGWKEFESKCLKLLVSESAEEKERERLHRERLRESKRARQIYFNGIPGLQQSTEDVEMDEVNGSGSGKEAFDEHRTLTFFASMCAALAIGAVSSPSSYESNSGNNAARSPAFFYALSQQALGVWDTHTTSFGPSNAAAYDVERLQYLLACFMGLQYLLLSKSRVGAAEAEMNSNSSQIQALVSKMATIARGIGLGRDSASSRKNKPTTTPETTTSGTNTSSSSSRGKKEKEAIKERTREEWKRRMLWEVVFYDLFTTDALGHPLHVPSNSFSMSLPSWAMLKNDAEQEGNVTGSSTDDNERIPSSSFGNGSGLTPESDEDGYLGSRYRLTQIAHTIKQQTSSPNCCCGYTYDHAAFLEDKIRRWQADLPIALQVPGTISVDASLHVQACELAILANLLIVKIYTPFLHPNLASTSALTGAGPTGNGDSSGPPTLLAAQAAASAAQTILRAAQSIRSNNESTSSGTTGVLPTFFEFYPLEKVLLNAVVICAHAGLTGKVRSLSWSDAGGGGIMKDIGVGVDMLLDLAESLDEGQKSVVDALAKRILLNRGTNTSLKRKHSRMDVSDPSSSSHGNLHGLSFTNAGVDDSAHGDTNMVGTESLDSSEKQGPVYLHSIISLAQQQQQQQHQSGILDASPFAVPSRSSFSDQQYPSDQYQPPRTEQHQIQLADALTPVSTRRGSGVKDANKEDQEKEKKHAKKSHTYPAVGIRVRTGKDVMNRSRTQSATTTANVPSLSSMASTPRSVPSASPESVLAYQLQQKQKAQQNMSAIAESSMSEQGSQQQQQQQRQRQLSEGEFAASYGPTHRDSLQPSTGAIGYIVGPSPELQPSPFSPEQVSYAPRSSQEYSPTMYEQSHSLTTTYDNAPISSSAEPLPSYNTVSSPFSNSNGPPSSSSSPFPSASNTGSVGHPPTPTFNGGNTKKLTPPVFGPQPGGPPPPPPPAQNSLSYYQTSGPFNPNGGYGSTPTATSLAHHGSIIPTENTRRSSQSSTMSEAVGHDKTSHQQQQQQQQPQQQYPSNVFGMKSSMDGRHMHDQQQLVLEQTRQRQLFEEHGGAGGLPQPLSMGINAVSQWPTSQQEQPHQHQHQRPHHSQGMQNSQAFWNNEESFRFYS